MATPKPKSAADSERCVSADSKRLAVSDRRIACLSSTRCCIFVSFSIALTMPWQVEPVLTTAHFMIRGGALVPPVHVLSASTRLPSLLADRTCTFVTNAGPFATRPHLFELGTGPVIGRWSLYPDPPPDNCKKTVSTSIPDRHRFKEKVRLTSL